MDVATERPVKAQLTTARLLLARRTPRGRDLSARLDGLKEGREKWAKKVDELEARLATEVTE